MENYQMQTTLDNKDITVTFRIEPKGDRDESWQAVIESIKTDSGEEIENDPEYDLEFECGEYFADLQFKHYMKTGEIL